MVRCTGFQRWKILMQSHLQTKGLNVWRVTSDGVKSTLPENGKFLTAETRRESLEYRQEYDS